MEEVADTAAQEAAVGAMEVVEEAASQAPASSGERVAGIFAGGGGCRADALMLLS